MSSASHPEALLGIFVKLRRATISFVMSVLPSVRMEQFDYLRTCFNNIWYLSILRKSAEKIQLSLKSDKNNSYFTLTSIYILIISRSVFLRMRHISEKVEEKLEIHILNSKSHFFRKSFRLWDNVEKYSRAEQATDDNMEYTYCTLDT
jgi:hypothetical protein